jgi:hypothetical protein
MALVFGNTEGNNRVIRDAMLKEQSEWLEEADKADSFTMIAVAKVIAEAFGKAAAKYKTTKETDFHDHEPALNIHGGSGSAWDDEHGVAPALPATGADGRESSVSA